MKNNIITLGLILGILLVINVLSGFVHFNFDLTEDQRYTLTKPTKQMLQELDDIVYVKVFLEGKFPAGFKRLRTSTLEMLEDFRSVSPLIEFDFEDPSEGNIEDVNARFESFRKDGLAPITKIKSQSDRSASSTVAVPVPIVALSPTPVA